MAKAIVDQETTINLSSNEALQGILSIPENAKMIVLFAHGSGSGRLSPRNRFVASFLVKQGLATLLLDLLTPKEEEIDEITGQYRFDIPLLAKRLSSASKWLSENKITRHLKIGYFGASTGSAAALIAAAQNEKISAVVSRGGRPDLASSFLEKVKAPTLLIVGGSDFEVIKLNNEAFKSLKCEKRMEIVPNATHLFEEKGALEKVASLAALWFLKY